MGKQNQQNRRQTRSHKNGNNRKPAPPMQPFIMLKTKIWLKDSHGLFDYEALQDQYTNENQKIFPFKKKIQKGQKISKQQQKQARIMIYRTRDCKTISTQISSMKDFKPPNDLISVCEIIAVKNKKKVHFKLKTALKLQNLSSALERQAQKLQNRVDIQQLNKTKQMISKINKQSQIKMINENKGQFQQLKDKSSLNLKSYDKQPQIKVFNPLVCPFTVTRKFYKGNSNVQGYPLKPGNIIKFGRVQYVVTELKTQKQFHSLRSTTDLKQVSGYEASFQITHRQHQLDHQSKSQGYVPTCKVCLCAEEQDENYLISPCKCKGYCGVIHIDCLKQWINNKVKKQHQGLVKSYNFNKFECEICKFPFPQIIKMGDKKIQMMSIQKPQKHYIIIESINPPRSLMNGHRQQERCLHVISTNQKTPLKIGRGHVCDIRISDISVSRQHAQMQFNDNKFLIKDTKSKFGTLILFDQQFDLNEKHPIILQSGRCSYEFSIQKEQIQQQNEGATQSQNEQQIEMSHNQDNQNINNANNKKQKNN